MEYVLFAFAVATVLVLPGTIRGGLRNELLDLRGRLALQEKQLAQVVAIVTDADPRLLDALEQKRLLPVPAPADAVDDSELRALESTLHAAATYTASADIVEVYIPRLTLLQTARLARLCGQHEPRLLKLWRKHHKES